MGTIAAKGTVLLRRTVPKFVCCYEAGDSSLNEICPHIVDYCLEIVYINYRIMSTNLNLYDV